MSNFRAFALTGALVLSLSACSSAPKPKAELAMTASALQAAESAGAREYAPIELRLAREKQTLADKAMADEEYGRAKRLSNEAKVDAELAKAKTDAERSRIALREVQNSVQMMRQEIGRANGQ